MMKKPSKSSISIRITILGVIFGFFFPLIATLVGIWQLKLPFTFLAVIQLHRNNTLIQIIDSAPIFLGVFAHLAGIREQRLREIKENLELTLGEQTHQIDDAYQMQTILNSLLSISFENLSLTQILEKTLDIILNIPWLPQNPKGGIFLLMKKKNAWF